MAFDTKFVDIQTKKILGVSEFAVNTKIGLDLEKPLKKVLRVSTISDVTNTESIDTDFSMQGKTQVNVLYLTENDTLCSVTGFADWQNNIKVAGASLQATVSTKEHTVEYATANEISISILLNAVAEGIYNTQISPVTQLSEDYVTQEQEVTYNKIVSCGSEKFVLTDNIEMPNATQVLAVDATVKNLNVAPGIDQISVEGEVDVKILYSTSDGVNTLSKILDYKREVACLNTTASSIANAKVNLSSAIATLETGEKTNCVLAITLNANVDNYLQQTFAVTTDLFSLSQNTSTVCECVNHTNFVSAKYYTDTLVSSINIAENSIDEIIAYINPSVEISQTSIKNNNLTIEGVAQFSIVYKDGITEQISASNQNCPFVSSIDIQDANQIENVVATISLNSVKLRSGKELETTFNLNVQTNIVSEQYLQYVKSIVEEGEKQTNDSAITIYVTKENESLFNVARALNVLPETITNQNEVTDGKFASGQRIFVYNPLNVEF